MKSEGSERDCTERIDADRQGIDRVELDGHQWARQPLDDRYDNYDRRAQPFGRPSSC